MRSLSILTVAATVALAAAASPASAQTGHSLTLAGPPSGTVGQPTVVQATGVVPDDVFLNRYLNVYAIPASVVPSCPPTFQNAIDLSYNTSAQGGDTVTAAVPAAGAFTIPVAYNPRVAGRFLLCGYVHEGVETMATAVHVIDVAGGGSPGGGSPGGGSPGGSAEVVRPANIARPKLKRSGRKLVCKRGSWSGSPSGYAYRWTVGGKRKAGARSRTLRVTRGLRDRKVRCRVTASNDAGSATALSRALRVR